MTAEQLRRYIADAEMAASVPRGSGDPLSLFRAHQYNATPELFAALGRLALAAMDERNHDPDDAYGWAAEKSFDAALRALEDLP